MTRIDILNYNELPCRFKLRSGKEIFGVIWETVKQDKVVHYFTSTIGRIRYKNAEQLNDFETCEQLKTEVNLEEIVFVEPLN